MTLKILSLTQSIGHIIGGSLRTLDQADSETMQANWWTADLDKLQREVPLRAHDMLSLIGAGKKWYGSKSFSRLPADVSHVSSSVRLVLVDFDVKGKGGEVSVLARDGDGAEMMSGSSLPVAVCGSQQDLIGDTLKVHE